MPSTDRVALVTGATGDLGRAVARRFAADGFRLVLAGTDADRLRSVAGDLGLADGTWEAAVADLTDPDATRVAVERAAERLGPIDVLAHLVGGWASGGPVTELDRDALRDQLDQHLWTTLNAIDATVPGMVERGWGRVMSVATVFATAPGPKMAAYAVPKIAQETLLRILARELGSSGVTANLVVVRQIDAKGERASDPTPKNAAWVTPEEIAATLGYLASEAAGAINGARIPLDGRG